MENSAGISFMGFTRMDLESAVCFLCAVVFSLFLMVFSWQDFHRKRIRVSWLYGFGTAGMALTMIRCVLSIIKDGWDWKKSVLQITVWLLGISTPLSSQRNHVPAAGSFGQGSMTETSGRELSAVPLMENEKEKPPSVSVWMMTSI